MIENDAEMARTRRDVIAADGVHTYWSTHCRHDRHADCAARELAPGVARRPAQCKICAAPCICYCHLEAANGPALAT
jgi:hypothetical protein